MSRTLRGLTVALTLIVLLQPMVPMVPAQSGGHDHSAHDHGSSDENASGRPEGSGGGNLFSHTAEPLTPGARYVEQQNPEVHGDFVVWEQRGIGRDWDIMAHNLSAGGDAFPLTTRAVDERHPVVRGPWVVWEAHHRGENASTDLVVFDVRTGRTINVPDSGHAERDAAIGGDATVYYFQAIPDERGRGHLRAFDLETRQVTTPIGNRTISSPPSAYQHWIAWAEGSRSESTINILDTRNGSRTQVPNVWALRDGPEIGRHGVAFIADHSGRQRGTYTVLYNETLPFEYMRSSVYPHSNVGHCSSGVVWDQPGSSTTDTMNVAIWDGFIKKRITFSPKNTDPSCAEDHLIFEKAVPSDDEDIGEVPRIYRLDLSQARLPADAEIEMAPGQARGIYSGPVVFEGTAEPGDPREPIQRVWGKVDNGEWRSIPFNSTKDGVEWQMAVDARAFTSGRHVLTVAVEDVSGDGTRRGFIFYTDVPYLLDRTQLDTGVDVPRTDPSPFPFNILDHYQAYQPFYNTIVLALVLLAVAVYLYYKRVHEKPPPTPEFVRPDENT